MKGKIRKFILKKQSLDKITMDYTDYHRFKFKLINMLCNEDLFRHLRGLILGVMCSSTNMSPLTRLREVP